MIDASHFSSLRPHLHQPVFQPLAVEFIGAPVLRLRTFLFGNVALPNRAQGA